MAFTGAGNSGPRSSQSGGEMEGTSGTTGARINERHAAALFEEGLSAFWNDMTISAKVLREPPSTGNPFVRSYK